MVEAPERRLLVIDDDPPGARLLQAIFRAEGFPVTIAHDGATGLEAARREKVDLVLLDLHLPDRSGLEVLEELRGLDAELPVVMLTADGDVKTAVRAIRLGAHDYLTKPIDADEIVVVARRALETRALKHEVVRLRRQVAEGGGLAAQMGKSAAVERIVEQVQSVARSSFSVLVLGETGTGKELVAQAIHRQSDRSAGPFIAVDCGAIPEMLLESELFGHEKGAFTGASARRHGSFRLAERGTLFLDEVGNLPLALQAKLLRVLESRQLQAIGAARPTAMDVRFIAATNDDLEARTSDGRFRADLYFRLAQYTIQLPPLRERREDIAVLAQRFLVETGVELRRPMTEIASDALSRLEHHAWPGNVRELRNVIRQAVLESREPVLRRAALQPFLARGQAVRDVTRSVGGKSLKETATEAATEAERQAIREALAAARGNKAQAARALRTDYKTLHLKMKSLGIQARDFTT